MATPNIIDKAKIFVCLFIHFLSEADREVDVLLPVRLSHSLPGGAVPA